MDPATIMMLTSLAPTVLGGLGGLGGEKEKFGSTYSKQARNLIDDVIGSVKGMKGAQDITQQPGYQTGLDWLQSMFNDPSFFNNFEAPIQRQFQEQIVPGLTERFGGGSGNAMGSTAFRRQLGREGSNLATNLAALRGGMQQQAIPQLLGYSQQPFSNYMSLLQSALTPTNNQYQPASAGFLGNIAPALIGGASQVFGNRMGQNMSGQSPTTSPMDMSGWDAFARQPGALAF